VVKFFAFYFFVYKEKMMKRKLLIVVCVAFGVAAFAQQVPTVAVATFDVIGGITQDEAAVVTELFMAELVATGKLKVVDRVNFDKIIAEMRFQTSDWSDSQKTARLGRALNAGYVIRGQLMKMGSVIYWTATMLDVNTAQVLYAAREQVSDMGQIWGKLPAFCNQMLNQPPLGYSPGSRGPGGGVVFFAEGDSYMECSEILGFYTWEQAKSAARNYRGGGFTDWRLPTEEELNLMYKNLREKNIGGLGDNIYWSSSEYDRYTAWNKRFSDGVQDYLLKTGTYSVRAVRAF
jgi:TolB-like protein